MYTDSFIALLSWDQLQR